MACIVKTVANAEQNNYVVAVAKKEIVNFRQAWNRNSRS
tara:strand:- start:10027 stop:10143 length:117 start_codon:yes stop_codon:yes gene_type:complete